MNRVVLITLLSLIVVGASVAASKSTEPAGPGKANGVWSVQAITSVGACSNLIPDSLVIVDNKITETTGANVSVWGYVDEAGAITARFTSSDEHVARFHGRFKGSNGAGAWSSSTDLCGGSWRAVRQ
ncbi:MAG: hypothetical protein EBS82_01875 [Methylocystaceae bacterium]|nr:hypothetical protein [Methylocystaceae bacterium]NBT96882.1 hypothetical protein [Methylocystaceae bacterium]